MSAPEFGKPTGLQFAITLMALALGCLMESASDWFDSLNPPSLTFGAIAFDALMIFIIGLVIGIPITILVWNRLLTPIFGVSRIRYVHGLVLVTAIYWIKGL